MTLLRQPSHWIILIIVLVIVFGASRLPSIAKNVGESFKVFKKEMQGMKDEPAQTAQPNATQTPVPPAQVTSVPPSNPVDGTAATNSQGETDPTKSS